MMDMVEEEEELLVELIEAQIAVVVVVVVGLQLFFTMLASSNQREIKLLRQEALLKIK